MANDMRKNMIVTGATGVRGEDIGEYF